MKSFSKILSLAALSLFSASALAAGKYVLTYDGNANITSFLQSQGLEKLKQVPGQPIYHVQDPSDRTEAQLIDAVEEFDAQDGVDDIQIYRNVAVGMSDANSSRRLTYSRTYLEQALLSPSVGSFFGSPAPLAFAAQPSALQTWVPLARTAFGRGSGIVAVIDTGVDPEHAFLKSALLPGYDFTRDEAGAASEMQDLSPEQQAIINPTTIPLLSVPATATVNSSTVARLTRKESDALAGVPLPAAFGHGTMVAGAIRLVAPGAKILPLKAFNANGTGTLFNIVRAIYYAQAQGAKIINLSLSTTTSSKELERAIRFVNSKGVICVASAGNDGIETNQIYPAMCRDVIGVASVNAIDARSQFSNYGEKLVKISAPGEEILLPYPGDRWAGGWGTSFAAPIVSGTAAMIVSVRPSSNTRDVQKALSHAAPLEGLMGYGRLNVFEAVSAAWLGLDD